jgi:hypothetical protein
MLLLYFLFVHVSLLLPGYVIVTNTRWFNKESGSELSFGYLVTIFLYAFWASISYVLKLNPLVTQVLFWLVFFSSVALFIYQGAYKKLFKERFPLLCLMAMSLFSLAFVTLSFNAPHKIIPDPAPRIDRNYNAFNVKVLNVAQTPANDNYIPYRQAQFFINRSDPGKDSFIEEWGVHFFQRTPLMGAVSAQYFNALDDPVPINYLWSSTSQDLARTYIKFQTVAQILNCIFIVPGFYLIWRLFSRKTAKLAALFIIPSQFFLYNAVFSWPKSLVAFFILLSWLFILQKRFRFVVLAGIASGLAYLSHDLAFLYIGASLLVLLYQKRFRDIAVFSLVSTLFAIPWLVISIFYYKKPSSFILYPLSIHDIPQPSQRGAIIKEFFSTSPLRLIAIRLESIYYLLSPYQLIYREGGQDWGRRFWAFGLFSVPGALGVGLITPAVLGAIKNIKNVQFWILFLVPILLSVVIIGWPKGLGALHFAEAIIVLLTGLACWLLISLKNTVWVAAAYALNVIQLALFVIYSYTDRSVSSWLHNPTDLARLAYMTLLATGCGVVCYLTARQPAPKHRGKHA